MEDRRQGFVPAFAALALGGLGVLALIYAVRHNVFRPSDGSAIGNLTRAYGTVRLGDSWNRLESDRTLLIPIRARDTVQTGEESAAEVLLYGGGRLEIAPESFVTFEDSGDTISVRVAMGRAYLDLPDEAGGGRALGFLRADGTVLEAPQGRRLALSLNAVETLENAVEVTEFPVADRGPDPFGNLELRLLAVGAAMGERRPLLVPPIEDRGRMPAAEAADTVSSRVPAPELLAPADEAGVDVDSGDDRTLRWGKVPSPSDDPVVSYEVVVRPAPGYEVEDTARKVQVFRRSREELDAEAVNGSGVFLWSVRAVTASGKRSPSSRPRWLEVKMPKLLRPPEVIQPQVR